jgi:hypothetical protein
MAIFEQSSIAKSTRNGESIQGGAPPIINGL